MSGIAQLGYIGFEVKDLVAWEKFATEVLGLQVAARQPDGALGLRMDAYQQRMVLEPGPADDLAFLGWEVSDEAALQAVIARLHAAGFETREGTEAERLNRRVKRLVKFQDPAGLPSELFYGPELSDTPFQSNVVRSGFKASENGMGHIVISANNQQESKDFYCNVLGFRLSDYIITELYGYKVNIAFFHINPRHHSIAFGEQQKKRLHHFMLEVGSMDDVGLAFDRTLKAGLRIMQTLGRHPNDRMFSFYAKTPSGFQFEYGWGARVIDDETWNPTTYDHISEWGHHPPNILVPPR